MKSDITRSTFKREKHYSGVRMQQGRVQLDADWNEQVDIANYRLETGISDTMGPCAAPKNDPGFLISVGGDNLLIGYGRFYVDGILCENEKNEKYPDSLPFMAQTDLPGETLPTGPVGLYLVYLDVWQRHITVVEDQNLHEVAVDVTDTTTRTQSVWQVKLFRPVQQRLNVSNPCGQDFDEWKALTGERNARLTARALPLPSTPENPCAVLPQAGFRGVANQLYRVEIHSANEFRLDENQQEVEIKKATFKWSRDNGSVVGRIQEIGNNTIILCEAPRDELLAFKAGHWVEVLNEERELRDGRGILVRLASQTEGTKLVFDPDSATEPLPIVTSKDAKAKWKVRRWDYVTASNKTPTIFAQNTWIALEDGIEVQFTAGDHYETGDYWLIPARTITGNVDWPLDDDDNPLPQERHGIKHHYCRLAMITLDVDGKWHFQTDCRPIFSPLIGQQNLFYVGGDGQEAMPGEELPKPLEVGVSQGQEPISLAHVRFTVIGESGTLNLIPNSNTAGQKMLDVLTGPDGLTKCYWKLAPFDTAKNNQSQQVEVMLLDPADQQIHLRFRFTANLSRAAATSYPLPPCGSDDSTILGLIPDLIAGLPQASNRTIQEILDIILCRLDADRLPYLPECEKGLDPEQELITIGDGLNVNAVRLAQKREDRRRFVPLLAQTLPCLRYRDGRNYFFNIPSPAGLVFDGQSLWVANSGAPQITRIDRNATDSAGVTTIAVPAITSAGAFDGKHVWFISPAPAIFIIDTQTSTIKANLSLDSTPFDIAFDGYWMWIGFEDGIKLFNIENFNIVNEFSFDDDVEAAALAFDGRYMWVAVKQNSLLRIPKPENISAPLQPELVSNDLDMVPEELAFDGSHVWAVQKFDPASSERKLLGRSVYKIDTHLLAVTKLPTDLTNSHGLIFDGEYMWLSGNSPPTANLNGIYFRNNNVGWMVGNDAAIFRTSNGGVDWMPPDRVPSDLVVALNAVYFATLNRGWAVGNNTAILFTDDGGRNWTRQSIPNEVAAHLYGVYFSNSNNGWAVGSNATLLSTENGGQEWRRISLPSQVRGNLRSIFFSGSFGCIVGDRATILVTTNGGGTWVRRTLTPAVTTPLRAVYLTSDGKGWAVGNNATLLITTNSGNTWTQQSLLASVTAHLRAVYFAPSGKGWIVGSEGTILTASSPISAWVPQSPPLGITANLNGLSIPAANTAFIVGDDASIMVTTNDGSSWSFGQFTAETMGRLQKVDVETNAKIGSLPLGRNAMKGVFDGTHLWLAMENQGIQKLLVG